MLSRQSKIRLLVPLTIIMVLMVAGAIGTTSSSFVDPESSADNISRIIAGWYDFAWGYRRPITLSNSGSALVDHQINVNLDTQALIAAGKMQADGDDIRFTASDGTTELPHWIESGIDTDGSSLWVKVPSVPVGDSVVYVYYGNSAAVAASSFTGVFPQESFEDFFTNESMVDWLASRNIVVSAGQAELDVSTALTEMEDQVQLQGGVTQSITSSWMTAQSLTIGISGILTRVAVKASKTGDPTAPLVMEVRNAVGDQPGTTVYASASKNPDAIGTVLAEHQFVLETPISVIAGHEYALVFRSTTDSYNIQYITSDVYSNGAMSRSLWPHDGSAWEITANDLYLKTYVKTLWRADQAQTGITGTREVYDTNCFAQSFLAAMSGELKQISLDMARIGSPPAEVIVEVRDVEQVAGELMDQYQTLYGPHQDVYGAFWQGQTFRAGSDGNLTKVAIRAAKTGEPGPLTVEVRDVVTGYQDVPDQSQSAYSGTRSLYGSTWAGQVFTAGLDGDLGKVVLWLSKIGNPGDLTLELRDVLQVDDELLDQSQTVSSPTMSIYDDDMTAQTFTAGMSGELTSIALGVQKSGNPPNPLMLEIRNVSGGDLPGTTIYATTGTSDISNNLSEHIFTFDTPATLVAGVKYAMVVYSTGGDKKNRYAISYNTADAYSGGQRATSWWGGVWSAQPDNDLHFKTYMTIAGYVPGEEVYASASESDVGNEGEYDLVFDPPYTVSAGTRYALVMYASDGNPANQYYLGYYSGDVYAAGREYTSTDSGSSWVGGDTDMYFKTYTVTALGDEPGDTVYATASRSDISSTAEYEFVLDVPSAVSTAANYALVVYASGSDAANYHSIYYVDANAYTLGKRASSSDGGSTWTPDEEGDLYFKVWVDVPAGYRPGSTVYASTTRNIFVSTTEKVEFLFDTLFELVAGQRYAIVARTTGGDASNKYVLSYQVSNVYGGGNESYSTNGGSDWSITSNDLWFQVWVNQEATGALYSVAIPVDTDKRVTAGIEMSWYDTLPTGSEIKYQVEYYTGSGWDLIPEIDLSGNSAGFDASPVDLSSVSMDYGQVRLKASFSTTDSAQVPSLQDWSVSYYYRAYAAIEPAVTGIGSEE